MSRSPLSIIDRSSLEPEPKPHLASWYTPGISDGLGDRLLMFDNTEAAPLELLRFKAEFSATPRFDAALHARFEQLAGFDHPGIAETRAVRWLGAGEGLALVSNHVEGRRLSEVLGEARGASFAADLVRQLGPVIAALERHDGGIGHGLLAPERIVVTPEGRLVIVEAVVGPAIEALRLPADRLRSELGVVVPPGADRIVLDSRADVAQLAWLALSLALGRRLNPAAYPGDLPSLLEEVAAMETGGGRSAPLRPWIERALSSGAESFGSAGEAEQALGEYLGASDRSPLSGSPDPESRTHDPIVLAPPRPARSPVVPFSPRPRTAQHPLERRIDARSPFRLPDDLSALPGRLLEPPVDERPTVGARLRRWAVAAVIVIAVGEALVIGALLKSRAASPAAASAGEIESATATPPATQPRGSGQRAGQSDRTSAQQLAAGVARPKPAAGGSTSQARPATGGVRLSSSIDLLVFESGRLVGSTARPFLLSAGSHDLELVNEVLGYRSRQTVEVKPRETVALSVYPPNGRLSVNATPWAEVWMNGQLVGETPLANLSVPVGSHEIVFKHPQFGVRRQTVVVKPEGLTRVSADLQR